MRRNELVRLHKVILAQFRKTAGKSQRGFFTHFFNPKLTKPRNLIASCPATVRVNAGKINAVATRLTHRFVTIHPVNATTESVRLIVNAPAHYAARLARNPAEIRAAQILRFEVFNLELNEGLPESYASGFDEDPFDAVCDHLIVEHLPSRQIVGTYRLQTGINAANHLGYYCAQEFEFAVFEPLRAELIELGRACVHRQHRNLVVLGMLWKGIADYARQYGARYLVGCSSLTSQDAATGASAYTELCRKHLVEAPWRTRPQPAFDCSLNELAAEPVPIPKLLRAYLALGAKICGPPALDRQFQTIDFLTLMDLAALTPATRERFFGE
jgi:putative hemolysin